MSVSRSRLGRVLGGAAAVGLGVYAMVTLVSAPLVALAGGCSKTNPAADVFVTQAATGTYSGATATSVTFTVTTENEGPCSASNVTMSATVADTGFPQLTVTVISTNPSSAACAPPVGGATGSVTLSCVFAKISAPSDASTNNPGTAVVTFSVTSSAGNLGGSGAPPVTSAVTANADSSTKDPQLGNNTSQGAFLVDGGSLSFSGFQTTTISVPKGIHGSAEIESGVNDPNPPKGSFGKIVLINSDSFLDVNGNPASPLQVVTFDVPITNSTPQSTSKVTVWHELDGTTTWIPVPSCTSSTSQPDPSPSCVSSVSKLKGGPTGSYFEIVVNTTVTSKWIN